MPVIIKDIKHPNMIDILYVMPGKLPVKLTIPNTLRSRRDLLNANGLVNVIKLDKSEKDKACLLVSEKSSAPANRFLNNEHGIIYGNFIILNRNKNGEYKSLSKEQIIKYQNMFGIESVELLKSKISSLLYLRRKLRK